MPLKLLLLTALVPALAAAACGDGRPAQARALISINGLADRPRFNEGMSLFHTELAGRADHHYLGSGMNEAGGTRGWTPAGVRPGDARTTIFNPDRGSLQTVAASLTDQVAAFRRANTTAAAEDFELVLFVTNHGDMQVDRERRDYGITLSPVNAKGAAAPDAETTLWSQQLREFGRSLPRGIRVKIVSSQCYGADAQETLLGSIDSPASCKCGISHAAPGTPAFVSSLGDPWDLEIIRSLSEGKPLGEAGLNAYNHHDMGRSPTSTLSSQNAGLSSSAQLVQQVIRSRMAANIKGIAGWTTFDLENAAPRILALGSARRRTLTADDRRAITESEARRARAMEALGLSEAARNRLVALVDAAEATVETAGSELENVVHRMRALRNAERTETEFREPTAAYRRNAALRLILQDRLEKAFFQIASAAERDAFRARLACEGDRIFPPRPAAPVPPPPPPLVPPPAPPPAVEHF